MKRTTMMMMGGAALALSLGACRKEANRTAAETGAYGAESTAAAAPSETPAVAESTAVGTLPPAVEHAEGLAEDVQDDIAGGKWSDAAKKAATLKTLGDSLKSTVPGAEWHARYMSQVDSLERQITARQAAPALQTANNVSRSVTEAMGHFSPKVPVAVSYMDVAGRDVVYAAERGDWAKASSALAELKARYGEVSSHVQSKDAALAKRIDQELATLTTSTSARDAATSAKTARVLLEEVDAIERTY
jgi:hypothetical protein